MSINDFVSNVRKATHTDTVAFPDADLLLYLNTEVIELAKAIEDTDEDNMGMLFTRDLVPTATSREYNLPSDLMDRFSKVEAKLDGVNWITLKELDITTYERTTDEATILQMFSNAQDVAKFDIFRNSLWIYTGAVLNTVVGGLKLWGAAYPTKITVASGTTDLSTPLSSTGITIPRLFHKFLAQKVIKTWKVNNDMPISLDEQETQMDMRLDRLLNMFKNPNRDRSIEQEVPEEEAWDDGYNL